jgi:hypothetical protein
MEQGRTIVNGPAESALTLQQEATDMGWDFAWDFCVGLPKTYHGCFHLLFFTELFTLANDGNPHAPTAAFVEHRDHDGGCTNWRRPVAGAAYGSASLQSPCGHGRVGERVVHRERTWLATCMHTETNLNHFCEGRPWPRDRGLS